MLNRDRIQLMWEARDLVDNFPLVKGILQKLELYTFGSLRYKARTGDREINAAYEAYFEKWEKCCDLSERHDFTTLVGLLFTSMLRDGDVGVHLVLTSEGWRLQCVEADRIGRPYEGPEGETYVGGILSDEETGAPRAYRIFRRTREGMYDHPVEVSASQFIHLFDPMRLDQVRGITHFDAAIDTARDIYDIFRYEKFAVKWASAQTGVVRREEGEAAEWETTGEKEADGKPLESIEFGRVNYLRDGENIETFRNERPSVTFSGFMKTLQQDVCLCLGIPYGFFVDPSSLGGAAGRLDSQQANRVCDRFQRIFLNRLLNRVKDAVIAFGIQFDGLPFSVNWKAGKWQFPAWPSSDLGRETAANIEEYKMGLRTASDIYAERNEDWEEQFTQLANEQKRLKALADEYGVPVEQLSQRFPNQTQPQPGGEAPTTPE
jgi:capsid protein